MTAFCRKSGGVAVALLAFLMGASRAAGGADNPKFWGSYKTQEPLEGLQVARRLSEVPEELAKRYPPSRYNVYAIDLDGDGKPDFIVENKTEWETRFVKSDLSRDSFNKLNVSLSDGFNYMFFVRLERGRLLTLFDFSGDEDYSDISLREFDPKTWKLEKLMPVIALMDSKSAERSGIYWAYPWDIRGLSTSASNGEILIQATFDHKIAAGQEERSAPGTPAILFWGTATQGDKTGPFDSLRSKLRFMSLAEIKKLRKRACGGAAGHDV